MVVSLWKTMKDKICKPHRVKVMFVHGSYTNIQFVSGQIIHSKDLQKPCLTQGLEEHHKSILSVVPRGLPGALVNWMNNWGFKRWAPTLVIQYACEVERWRVDPSTQYFISCQNHVCIVAGGYRRTSFKGKRMNPGMEMPIFSPSTPVHGGRHRQISVSQPGLHSEILTTPPPKIKTNPKDQVRLQTQVYIPGTPVLIPKIVEFEAGLGYREV